MKKFSVIKLIVMTILISQMSCVINEVEESKDKLYPIKTGNTWTYKRTQFSNEYVYLIDTIDMVVGKRTTIDGHTGYSFDNKEINTLLFLVDNDKYGNFVTYGCYIDTFTRMDRSIRFKLNSQVNDSWYYQSCNWGWYTGTIITSNLVKCISQDTLITTPSADYHCIAFRESMNDRKRYSYLSVNVGLVKQVTSFDIGYSIVEELLEYKLY